MVQPYFIYLSNVPNNQEPTNTMYCLSKICCFCLQSKQLKLLNEINSCTSLTDIIKILIGESLFELGHILSICKDCTKQVKQVHSFRQTCLKNYKTLMKHLQPLRTSGNDFGDIRIQINDIYKDKWINESIYTAEHVNFVGKTEDLKIKDEELSGNEDTITYTTSSKENRQYENQTEEEEFKIETNDFEKVYDPLECEKSTGENEVPISIKEEPILEISVEELEIRDDFRETYSHVKCEFPEESIPENFERRERETHTLIHTVKKPNRCGTCGKHFTQRNTLNNHPLTHVCEKPYRCEMCGKSFTQRVTLTNHILIHTGEKPYTCETCGKSFTQRNTLTNHLLTHTGERPYKCETCGKSFTVKINLTTHTLTHTGEKPYKCESCGKRFARKNILTNHMSIHTGEKPHKCKTCGKSFSRKSILTEHMSVHTGDKPHKCETCGKSFTRKNILTNHMLLHTGEKRHKCQICGKSFFQKYHLIKHMSTHADEKT